MPRRVTSWRRSAPAWPPCRAGGAGSHTPGSSPPRVRSPATGGAAMASRATRGRTWLAAAAVLPGRGGRCRGMSRPVAPATIIVANRLLSPVWLTLADGRQQLVDPGDSLRVQWPAGRELTANWSIVRPVSANGKALGEELKGSFKDRRSQRRRPPCASTSRPRATRCISRRASPTRPACRCASPCEPTPGQRLCDCDVPSDASPTWLGYYRLVPGTTVPGPGRIGAAGGVRRPRRAGGGGLRPDRAPRREARPAPARARPGARQAALARTATRRGRPRRRRSRCSSSRSPPSSRSRSSRRRCRSRWWRPPPPPEKKPAAQLQPGQQLPPGALSAFRARQARNLTP